MTSEWEEDPGVSEGLLGGEDLSQEESVFSGVNPEDTVDPLDVPYRLSVRISPSNPFHAPIVSWLSGFPKDNRGMRDIGTHLVKALLLYLDSSGFGGRTIDRQVSGPERFASQMKNPVSRGRSLPSHVRPPVWKGRPDSSPDLSKGVSPSPSASPSPGPVSPEQVSGQPIVSVDPVSAGFTGSREPPAPKEISTSQSSEKSRRYAFFAGSGGESGEDDVGW